MKGVDPYNVLSDENFHRYFNYVVIESSTFQGGHGPFFTIDQADVKISESVFHIPSNRNHPEHLVNFHKGSWPYHVIALRNVLMNVTVTGTDVQQVNIMSLVTYSVIFQNTQILFPLGLDAVETTPLNSDESWVYQCVAVCTSDMYTFQSGNMTIYSNSMNETLESNLVNPHCNQCPVGAKCNLNIKALPNYWGYKTEDDVTMIRCPTGYCCQDDESCLTFDSCNSNRSGPLCGVCEKGFAESLYGQTCIPVEKCHTWFIVLLYISCVIGYGLGLMVIDSIKEAVISSLKKMYQGNSTEEKKT